MILLKVNPAKPDKKTVQKVVGCLNKGGVIIYPTDTVYGLGCRIDKPDSIRKIVEIKKRKTDKPLSIACADFSMIKQYAVVDEIKKDFILDKADKGYTFILQKKNTVDGLVVACGDTVGVRLVPLKLIRDIIAKTGCPIVSTSANYAGGNPPAELDEIEKDIRKAVDLVLDGGGCAIGKPSRVVGLHDKKILRD